MTQLKFDGLDVEQFGGRFSGTFDLEENFAYETEVAFQVIAKVTAADMRPTKTGDVKRINIFEVVEVGVFGQVPSRKMVAAQQQVKGQLTLTGDGDFDDEEPEVEEENSVVFSAPPRSAASVAAVPLSVPQFGNTELLGEDGWN